MPEPTSPTPDVTPAPLTLTLHGVDATRALGSIIAAHARREDLIALDGELGAGKTQFVRGMAARLLGTDAPVASPTFVMVHEYGPIIQGRATGATLVHVDAYRIDGEQALETIGWSATGGGELAHDAIVVVEWASRIESALGNQFLRVQLTHADENERIAVITPQGPWHTRIAAIRAELESIPDIQIHPES